MTERQLVLEVELIKALTCLLAIAAVMFFCPVAKALPPLDMYGGRTDISCTNATGHFILVKLNARWWFCTPLGHVFISQNITFTGGNPTTDCNGMDISNLYNTKYGPDSGSTGGNQTWQWLKRATSWQFNSTGIQTAGEPWPWETCTGCSWPGGTNPIPVPTVIEDLAVIYAGLNTFGYLSEPIKSSINGTDDALWGSFGNASYDIFDPKWATEMQQELAPANVANNDGLRHLTQNNPWILGYIIGDTDWFVDFGPGPDVANGVYTGNLGLATFVASPRQTLGVNIQGSQTFIYQNTLLYAKAQANNPTHGTCSVATNPCSLRDYLYDKYNASISSLNTAWGSNYTTFDSTGTQVTGETIGTGNGSAVTFTHTLAHTPVSPFSVLISVGGVAQIGDYPWFKNSGTVNTGQLLSPTTNYVTSSTINYSTGVVSVTFVTAPANGAAITVNYIYGGWMAGGTGLMDDNGSSSWVGTNLWCLEGADPSFPTYFACTGAGGHYLPVPNANANFGADVDNWIPQWVSEFNMVAKNQLLAAGVNIPYFGIDDVGGWGAPPYSKILQGQAQCIASNSKPCVDMMFTQLAWFLPTATGSGYQPSKSPEVDLAYQYLTKYAGDVPLGNFVTIPSQTHSSESCNSPQGSFTEMPDQPTRGLMYYDTVKYLWTTPGYNNDYQFVLTNWWAFRDFQGENWGVVTLRDNAYDGAEDVTASVSCDNTYTVLMGAMCGSDTGNFGNALGGPAGITAANTLWLGSLSAIPTITISGASTLGGNGSIH